MSQRQFITRVTTTFAFTCVTLLSAVAVSCSSQDAQQKAVDAQPMWMQTSKTDDATVQNAVASQMAVQINLTTNRATLFKQGKAVDQWNIASADVTGEFHDNIPQSTPTGVFAVEDMQVCPTWLPRAPKDPKTGKVAANEQERMAIIRNNPELFGPCGAKNPLGSYVIWFHGEYGIHGNAAEWILDLANPEERRVSGGCIRNPNSKIKDVFHLVIDSFPQLSGFRQQTLSMEAAQAKDKKTLTQSLSSVDMKVVVGRWAKDPQIAGSAPKPSQPPVPSVSPTPAPTPTPQKMRCEVVGVDPVKGVALVYSKLPANFDNEYSFFNRGEIAIYTEELPGTGYVRTSRGLIEKKMLGNCQIQN